jgi:hypothetical protein
VLVGAGLGDVTTVGVGAGLADAGAGVVDADATAAPLMEAPGDADWPGPVLRAITSTTNATIINATRRACPPVRVGAPDSGDRRPLVGSSSNGVERTAGHRLPPSAPDAGCWMVSSRAARYVAHVSWADVRHSERCLSIASFAAG